MSYKNPSWTVATSGEDAENHAIFAGYEADEKTKVYVGRLATESGDFIPAKVIPHLNLTYYENEGKELSSNKIDYLLHSDGYEWYKSSDGAIVPDAVTVSNYYIGRAVYNGNTVVGRVDLGLKQLITSFGGNALNLSNYDVLVFKPQDKQQLQQAVAYSTNISQERQETTSFRSERSERTQMVRESSSFNQQRFFEMRNKIQNLEFELANYRNDRENYEKRIEFEHKRVQDLSSKMQGMKIENSSYVKERVTYEERMNNENQRMAGMESKLQSVLIDNTFLLKKITSLEEALKYEKYQMDTFNSKHQNNQAYISTLLAKIKNYEESLKTQQQRVFELESQIENSNSSSESLVTKITTYESTISHQKLQVENILKQLQSSNSDNEFLINKLNLLTQSLRNYQYQLETLTTKLQNSKSIIASAHADLAKANAQISKYQAALSSCYILNGQLMTKVSGMSSMAQYQTSFDSSFDILSITHEMSMATSAKSVDLSSTSSLLEATGSESYINFIKTTQANESENESIRATPATPY